MGEPETLIRPIEVEADAGELTDLLHRAYPELALNISTWLGLYMNMPTSPARTFVQEAGSVLDGGTANVFCVPFPAAFFRDFVERAPVFSVREIVCPVLFLQGTKDNPYRRSDA